MRRHLLVALASMAVFLACEDDPVSFELDENGFAAFLNVDLSAMTETPTGLLYQDFVVGTGAEAMTGGFASVSYTGWLKEGPQFDAGTFNFTMGAGDVIAGWDEGIPGMREGGTRRLIIPPELGYGSAGRGSIPPGATLVFDVTLLQTAPPS
ncbi:MAG: FKBP-type peptidyl-prolyl cis-trans isomerase [Gemmatimonadota bacterium]|nr:FKBP-type peptidyl-prolyl cis-trans isomerase [Gemmatimonadota bacterium]